MKNISLFFLCLMAQVPVIAQLESTLYNGSVLAARNGQIVFQQSHGWANIEERIPNSASTNFELTSLSKVFTAVAVMQLVQKSAIRLDDPVNKYLKDFPYKTITVRQLLSHTGGLPDFELFDKAYQAKPDRVFTKEDIIPALKEWGPLKLAPGQQWSYSSPGIAQSGFNVMRSMFSQPVEIMKTSSTFPFARDLMTNGIDHATLLLGNIMKDTLHYKQPPIDWIAMGYELYRTDHLQEALATFRIGHVLYPENDFLCMLYGDAIAKNGDVATAKAFYQKALLLNPDNKEAAARLK
jgi:hypothetical protein